MPSLLRLTAALLLAVTAHLVVLYLPGEDVPGPGFEIPGLDKLIHVVVFAGPTLLAVRLARSAWAAVPFAVHAPVSEWLQARLAQGRTGDAVDVVADLVGVALGLAAAAAWLRYRGRRRDRPA